MSDYLNLNHNNISKSIKLWHDFLSSKFIIMLIIFLSNKFLHFSWMTGKSWLLAKTSATEQLSAIWWVEKWSLDLALETFIIFLRSLNFLFEKLFLKIRNMSVISSRVWAEIEILLFVQGKLTARLILWSKRRFFSDSSNSETWKLSKLFENRQTYPTHKTPL